jgi:hypothetical protein
VDGSLHFAKLAGELLELGSLEREFAPRDVRPTPSASGERSSDGERAGRDAREDGVRPRARGVCR